MGNTIDNGILKLSAKELHDKFIIEADKLIYPINRKTTNITVKEIIRAMEAFVKLYPDHITCDFVLRFGKLCILEGEESCGINKGCEIREENIALKKKIDRLNQITCATCNINLENTKLKKKIEKLEYDSESISGLRIRNNILEKTNARLNDKLQEVKQKRIDINFELNKKLDPFRTKIRKLNGIIKNHNEEHKQLKLYVKYLKSKNQELNDLVVCYKKNENNDTTKEKDDEYRNRYIEIENQYIEKEQQYKKEIRRLKTNLYYSKCRSRKNRKEVNSLKRKLKKINKEN